jgi:glyoxylase-like metal-dependent hydrolase (beta-lactamase superfamily II)
VPGAFGTRPRSPNPSRFLIASRRDLKFNRVVPPALRVETIPNGPFVENCFVAMCEPGRNAVVIDPGDEPRLILAAIRRLGANVGEIWCTHGHVDHAGAVAPLQHALGVPFAIHAADEPWLDMLESRALAFGIGPRQRPVADRDLFDGQDLCVGELRARVLHTPGHTPGGCCFHFPEQRVVFVGDTLFAGSVGRVDLPLSSAPALLRSIREQLLALDDDVTVYSGHGPATDIGTERRTNPFLRPGARLDP